MRYRHEKLNSLIRDELSRLVARNLEFPGSLPTITEVGISDDLAHAEIKVSVIPSSKEKETLKILGTSADQLRHLLLKKLKIRAIPRLVFKIDKGPEKAARVEKILLEDNIE